MSESWNGIKVDDLVQFNGQKGVVCTLDPNDSNHAEIQLRARPYEIINSAVKPLALAMGI